MSFSFTNVSNFISYTVDICLVLNYVAVAATVSVTYRTRFAFGLVLFLSSEQTKKAEMKSRSVRTECLSGVFCQVQHLVLEN